MITASYYPDEFRHDERTGAGFKTYRDAMAWIMADATSRHSFDSDNIHHGLWFWYRLYKNDEEAGCGQYQIRPLLKGKNKGKPAMFRYTHNPRAPYYRLKSKSF